MTSTVVGFELGFTSSGNFPYALAQLSCGKDHVSEVVRHPNQYSCGGCGKASTVTTKCDCGYVGGYKIVHISNPHVEADRVTKIGDVVECTECAREAAQLAWLRELPRELVQHARFKRSFGHGVYHFYRREATSPTGVLLIGSVKQTDAIEALLNEKRISPLSPTETR